MLLVHRAERADKLVAVLGDLLVEPPDDPMVPEIVAVPTRGIERWISQRLSGRLGAAAGQGDGVCANVDFPFPGRLVGRSLAAAADIDPATDPWLAERSVWPLLAVVDTGLGEPWLETLARHLGALPAADEQAADEAVADLRQNRRFAAVRHLADLYDRYGVHRPAMLRAWAAGADEDGHGDLLPGDRRWQAELWRRLRAAIGRPSPAERLADACRRLEAEPALAGLPPRFSLFGITRLPASAVEVLRALAEHRDVHLFLLHPSPTLWERVATANPPTGPLRRRADPTAALAHSPLLASWGQDAREMQLVLGAAGADCPASPSESEAAEGTSLLARLQADVRADRRPSGEPLPGAPDGRPALDPSDRSLQVHACHGRARQVEVLRDAVLHLLAADPTLEPRDIIVMCPDVEAFAPLVHATFGAADGGDEPTGESAPQMAGTADLRVRLADRALRQTNPVLGVTALLLDLATSRLTAAQVLDLAGREPVRRRFGFDDDDLARLKDWAVSTGVRWGLDAEHRAPYKLPIDANTWRAGLDRVLVGVAMTDDGDRLFGGTLPFDDVDSGDIDLAGRFAEYLDRLEVALGWLAGPQPLAAWAEALAASAATLTEAGGPRTWQAAELAMLLGDLVGEATTDGATSAVVLSLPEVRALLADRLRGRPTRANFRTGHLTVCTLVPMRSVPHRVVCLLGLDDGVFPRRSVADGDDLVAADPWVGDRDGRSEDRQLLLDALLAATDTLVVTYSGRDERTNSTLPPAVPLGELLDVVDATVAAPGGARQQVVTAHPLQPFDVRNFAAGALVGDQRWSFDGVALDGARALASDRHATPPFLVSPLPADSGSAPIELEDLVRFVQHPVRAFLRQRLGVMLAEDSAEVADALPVELDALEQWGVGQRLLDGRLSGTTAEDCVRAEMARGTLPPGALAHPILDRLGTNVEAVVAEAQRLPGREAGRGEPTSAEVNLVLPDGRRLAGTVPGLLGQSLQTVTYSKVGPQHRLAAWARLLALAATYPGEPFEAVTVGRSRDGARTGARTTVVRVRAPALGALEMLTGLVDLLGRGRREPLPIFNKTSAAWAEARRSGRGRPDTAATAAWESSWDRAREDKDLSNLLVLGGQQPFSVLLEALPAADESGPGWEMTEESRFGRYARRLWDALLAAEEVTDR